MGREARIKQGLEQRAKMRSYQKGKRPNLILAELADIVRRWFPADVNRRAIWVIKEPDRLRKKGILECFVEHFGRKECMQETQLDIQSFRECEFGGAFVNTIETTKRTTVILNLYQLETIVEVPRKHLPEVTEAPRRFDRDKSRNVLADTETSLIFTEEQLQEWESTYRSYLLSEDPKLEKQAREFLAGVKSVPWSVAWALEEEMEEALKALRELGKEGLLSKCQVLGLETSSDTVNKFLEGNGVDEWGISDGKVKNLLSNLLLPEVRYSIDPNYSHTKFTDFLKSYSFKGQEGVNIGLTFHNLSYDVPYLRVIWDKVGIVDLTYFEKLGSKYKPNSGAIWLEYPDGKRVIIGLNDTLNFHTARLSDDTYKTSVPYNLANLRIEGDLLIYYDWVKGKWGSTPLEGYLNYILRDITELFLLTLEIEFIKCACIEASGMSEVFKLHSSKKRRRILHSLTTKPKLSYQLYRASYLLQNPELNKLKILDRSDRVMQFITRKNWEGEKKYGLVKGSPYDFEYLHRPPISLFPPEFWSSYALEAPINKRWSFIHASSNGGFTFNNSRLKGGYKCEKGREQIFSFDVNSQYPSVIAKGLPAGLPKLNKTNEDDIPLYRCRLTKREPSWSKFFDFLGFYIIDVDPNGKEVIKPVSKIPFGLAQQRAGLNDSLYLWGDYFTYIKQMIEEGALELQQIYYFDRCTYGASLTNSLYKKRQENKDTPLDKGCKIVLNSIFGKCAERVRQTNQGVLNLLELKIDNGLEEGDWWSILSGTYISQMGQAITLKAIWEFTRRGFTVLCGDTDSVKVLVPLDREKEVMEIIEVDPNKLGAWKMETRCDQILFDPRIRKKYSYFSLDIQDGQKMANAIKFSGVDGSYITALEYLAKKRIKEVAPLLLELFNQDKNFRCINAKRGKVQNSERCTILYPQTIKTSKESPVSGILELSHDRRTLYWYDASRKLKYAFKDIDPNG